MARRTYAFARAIGQRMERARQAAGLSINELAERALVHRNTVARISEGQSRNPGAATLADLARALRVSPCWLAYGVGAGPPD
jgi:transcriptional regulator with XRE-family HTH domain